MVCELTGTNPQNLLEVDEQEVKKAIEEREQRLSTCGFPFEKMQIKKEISQLETLLDRLYYMKLSDDELMEAYEDNAVDTSICWNKEDAEKTDFEVIAEEMMRRGHNLPMCSVACCEKYIKENQ